jgi:hypothetical protein
VRSELARLAGRFTYPREDAGRYRAEEFSAPSPSEFDRREQPVIFRDLTPS